MLLQRNTFLLLQKRKEMAKPLLNHGNKETKILPNFKHEISHGSPACNAAWSGACARPVEKYLLTASVGSQG
jgi:hypothetical protein